MAGLLQLTLKSAADLQRHDLFGKQQPYCVVHCGKYMVRSKTCKDGCQNPIWNETLFFQVSNEPEVTITVFVEHQLSKDAAVGAATIPITRVRRIGNESVSVPVMLKGKQAGMLHATLDFKGATITHHNQVGHGSTPSSFTAVPYGSGSLTVAGQSRPSPSIAAARSPATTSRPLQQANSGVLDIHQVQQPSSLQPLAATIQQQPAQSVALADTPAVNLQQQQSAPVLPAEVAALQQVYSQQLQQLQGLQQQILYSLPPDIWQQQQQQLRAQQQLLGHLAANLPLQCVPRQLQQQQQVHTLHFPLQPKKTAADLFKPDTGLSDAVSSMLPQDMLSSMPAGALDSLRDALLCESMMSGDGNSAQVGFNLSRLHAIIAKVYPEHASQSVAHIAQGSQPLAHSPTDSSSVQSVPMGAFSYGAAAAAAAGACPARQPSCSGMGGFAGAAGAVAAQAALQQSSTAADQRTNKVLLDVGSAGTAPAAGAVDGDGDGISSQHMPPVGVAVAQQQQEEQQYVLQASAEDRQSLRQQTTTAATPMHMQAVGNNNKLPLLQAVPSAAAGAAAIHNAPVPGSTYAAMPQQQTLNAVPVPAQSWQYAAQAVAGLPPNLSAVLEAELSNLPMAAPLLSHLLGLQPAMGYSANSQPNPWTAVINPAMQASSTSQQAAAVPVQQTPINHQQANVAADSGSPQQIAGLQKQLASAKADKAHLASLLEERNEQLLELQQQLALYWHQLQNATARLAGVSWQAVNGTGGTGK
eukprot:GHRR01016041.1.p1 GENE.GHRR01016041.1~~GHRR01016041.1.p1  ORF type:complete len:754 (+),score=357.52 GHRR01016041.1:1268-3529(+)